MTCPETVTRSPTGGFAYAPINGAGRQVFLQGAGPRDGLQMESCFVPTEHRTALVNALSRRGNRQATAHPGAVRSDRLRERIV